MGMIYHKGKLTVQEINGESKRAVNMSKTVKNTINEKGVPFVERQNMAIVSSTDSNNKVWISLIIGLPEFVDAKQPGTLYFDTTKIISPKIDIVYQNIKINQDIGIIFIELGSKMRYRVNGIATLKDEKIEVKIKEAYPNCPLYIRRKIQTYLNPAPTLSANTKKGINLTLNQKNWISKANTFFVGSKSKKGMLDASHRGGPSGFIKILKNGTLKIPDYKGNSMYNTLGNMYEQPNSGLLFIDFEQGAILQLSGKSKILFHQEIEELNNIETGKYWLFETEEWVQTDQHHQITWKSVEDTVPFNPVCLF